MAFQQGIDTAGSIWRSGSGVIVAEDAHRALLRQIIHFACGKALPDDASFSPPATGNGTIEDIDGGVDAPTETWTISFTSATDFTVTGSVSGAQPAGTVNSNYTTTGDPLTSLISFRITPGSTAFVPGDEFSFDVTLGPLSTQNSQWILDRWSPFTTAGDGFNAIDDTVSVGTTGAPILHGQGDGSESFTIGLAPVETPASQIWNFKIRGYTGFSVAENWETNLGASDAVYTALWNNDMTYWLVVNSRRLCATWVVSTTMHSLYAGAILPFASPQEWPYPLAIIGEKGDEEPWSSTSTQFHHGIMRPDTSNGWLRRLDGY